MAFVPLNTNINLLANGTSAIEVHVFLVFAKELKVMSHITILISA